MPIIFKEVKMIKDFKDNVTEEQVLASLLGMCDSRGGRYAEVYVVPLTDKEGKETGKAKKFTIAVVGEVVELHKQEPKGVIKL